ncbi:MAG: glutamate--tRNA ligase [Candidatus Saccharibacteria bacterium]|nr:glutamate--tRNA ligase [Candidatus Saccharibacteria bacterium]
MNKAVTRFAPSPTGYIHIGNVRSAIYPYLVAKQTGGKMILRIEDTDQDRYVEGATELIMDTLNWLGLEWDEGAGKTGPNGPYFQSERKEIYHQWAQKLIDAGRAYADDTPAEKIDEYRKADQEAGIPFLYRNHRPDHEVEWKEGVALRFKTEPKNYDWTDEVMGKMHTGPEVLDDIILIKRDGLPTYNFGHIVDDAEMGVTHIMRGVEYLSSMPNYLAIYEALGIEHPKFVSLPHILAPTGNKKLGKRDGAKSVTEYREDGVLPEAMLNYLACLGWNDGTEQEVYTKNELIEKFSIDRVQNSGARFDEVKIGWMNGQWIRRIFDEQGVDALYARTLESADEKYITFKPLNFWPENAANEPDEYKKQVLAIIYDRLKTLSDLRTMTTYFFADPEIDLAMITENKFLKKLSEKELADLLTMTIEKLSSVEWTEESLQNALNELLEKSGKKPAEYFSLVRISVSFAPFSPALHLTLNVLGKDKTIARLNQVRTALVNG